MISDKALQEFKEIWRTEMGADISDVEAVELATNLLTLMDAIYEPIRRDWTIRRAVDQ